MKEVDEREVGADEIVRLNGIYYHLFTHIYGIWFEVFGIYQRRRWDQLLTYLVKRAIFFIYFYIPIFCLCIFRI